MAKATPNKQLARIAEAIESMDRSQERQAEAASIRALANALMIALVIGQFLAANVDIPAAIFGFTGYAFLYFMAHRRSKGGDEN